MRTRNAFIVDLNKCTGCHACEMACQIANDVPGGRRWRRVRTFNELHVHNVEVVHLSMACNHCAEAPCADGCPSRAIYRDDTTGAVLIDQGKCIGCRYCSWVCPFGAPRFDEDSGVMAKCDFCVERQRQGGSPACVAGCPTGALDWGDLPDDELTTAAGCRSVPGLPETAAGPSIHIVALEPKRLSPKQTERRSIPPWKTLADRIIPDITLGHEWPLAVFTLLISILVGIFLGSCLGAPAPDGGVFLAVGIAGLLLGAFHLGRRARAWRAAAHVRRSWLSREIVIFGAFLVLGALELHYGGLGPTDRVTEHVDLSAWLAMACGIATLLSVDHIYRIANIRGGGIFHSAHLLGTGLMLAAVWAGAVAAAAAIAGIKAVSYWRRKRDRGRLGLPVRPRLAALRLGTLAAAGVAAWWGAPLTVVFVIVVVSELIDRAEYYDELEIPTPESLMLDELKIRTGEVHHLQ
jgi:DMSO reductase iron-sulfur subunit